MQKAIDCTTGTDTSDNTAASLARHAWYAVSTSKSQEPMPHKSSSPCKACSEMLRYSLGESCVSASFFSSVDLMASMKSDRFRYWSGVTCTPRQL